MNAEQPDKMRLGVGFAANQSHAQNPNAWRNALGTKKIPARLEMLPNAESRWSRVGLSAGAQTLLLLFFVAIPMFFPERLQTAMNYIVVPLAMPVTEVPIAPRPQPPKAVRVKPEPVQEVKLNPKQPHIFVQQKVPPPKVQQLEAKEPVLTPIAVLEVKFNTQMNQPKRPREGVKINNLSSGSAAPATLEMPVNKVQTGGFGDPNGLPGKGDPNKTTNSNRLGSPLPPGGSGYGNGTAGDKGARGTVQSTGFGNGTAIPPQGGASRGTVRSSGFGNQSVVTETEAPSKKAAYEESATSAVTILDKPRPEYTNEGRTLKIEGDVVLEIVFLSSGSVQINQVVSGLGHGLDEAAGRAAQQIKFKPAKRDGQLVDFPARVRIEFRLAY